MAVCPLKLCGKVVVDGVKAYVEDLVMNAQFVVDAASSSSSCAPGGLHVSLRYNNHAFMFLKCAGDL